MLNSNQIYLFDQHLILTNYLTKPNENTGQSDGVSQTVVKYVNICKHAQAQLQALEIIICYGDLAF
jgi:hypothetical protein